MNKIKRIIATLIICVGATGFSCEAGLWRRLRARVANLFSWKKPAPKPGPYNKKLVADLAIITNEKASLEKMPLQEGLDLWETLYAPKESGFTKGKLEDRKNINKELLETKRLKTILFHMNNALFKIIEEEKKTNSKIGPVPNVDFEVYITKSKSIQEWDDRELDKELHADNLKKLAVLKYIVSTHGSKQIKTYKTTLEYIKSKLSELNKNSLDNFEKSMSSQTVEKIDELLSVLENKLKKNSKK